MIRLSKMARRSRFEAKKLGLTTSWYCKLMKTINDRNNAPNDGTDLSQQMVAE